MNYTTNREEYTIAKTTHNKVIRQNQPIPQTHIDKAIISTKNRTNFFIIILFYFSMEFEVQIVPHVAIDRIY